MRAHFSAAILALALARPAHADDPAAARARLADLNRQEAAIEARLDADRHALAALLGALELFSRDPPPPLLVSPGDARDAVRAMILAKALAPALQARANTLAQEADALSRLRRQAAEASGDLFAAESDLADRQDRLDALDRDAPLLAPPAARAEAAQRPGAGPPPLLTAPTPDPLAVPFGGRLDSGLIARGLAYKTDPGAPVRSPAAAMVAYAGPLKGWGQIVILRAAGGCHMVLSGLGKVTVIPGQSVAAAFPLGSMPADGHVRPELYFEVRLASGPVDPASLMAGVAASHAKGRGDILTRPPHG